MLIYNERWANYKRKVHYIWLYNSTIIRFLVVMRDLDWGMPSSFLHKQKRRKHWRHLHLNLVDQRQEELDIISILKMQRTHIWF